MMKVLRRYYWPLSLLLCGLWVLVAFGLMPDAIRAAHAGGGIGILRRAMEQASKNPVQGYLDQWDGFARRQLFNLVGAILIGYVGMRLVTALRSPVATRASDPEAPAVGALLPVWLGVWFGVLSGIGEGVYVAMRSGVLHRAVHEFTEANLNTAFLAPATNVLIFAGIGVLVAVFDRGRSSGWAARFAAALFAGLTMAGWVLMAGRVNGWAGTVLAGGVGVQVWRWAGPHMGRFRSYVVPSIGRGVALLAAVAILRAGLGVIRPDADAPIPAEGSPNVLWLVLDTERAKSLDLYGYGRETSPELTRFAGDAVVFDRAITPSSWTLPSHASYFTGLPAADLDVWAWLPLPESRLTVAEVLRRNGYQTAGFGGNLIFLNPSFGLTQGFTDWYGTPMAWRTLGVSTWLVRTARVLYRRARHRHDYLIQVDAREINARIEDWLDQRDAGRPFFVFANYFDAHEPYDAHPEYLPAPADGDRLDWLAHGTHASDYRPDELRDLLDGYESEIRWLDAEVGRLLASLNDRGELDRTLVIITSDHGELFGEHNLLDHANSLYRPLLHVPLVVRPPGGVAGGVRVAATVETRNIGRSILEVLGVPADSFPGTSLARWWSGDPVPAGPVISSQRGWISVMAEGFHYILRGNGSEHLFRLSDSEEVEDLGEVAEFDDVRRRLRSLLPGDPP